MSDQQSTQEQQWLIRFIATDGVEYEAGPYEDERYTRSYLAHLHTRKSDPQPSAHLLTRTLTVSEWVEA